jgi:hypothetical protein
MGQLCSSLRERAGKGAGDVPIRSDTSGRYWLTSCSETDACINQSHGSTGIMQQGTCTSSV